MVLRKRRIDMNADKNKVAIVTGAARGIGAAISTLMEERGFNDLIK